VIVGFRQLKKHTCFQPNLKIDWIYFYTFETNNFLQKLRKPDFKTFSLLFICLLSKYCDQAQVDSSLSKSTIKYLGDSNFVLNFAAQSLHRTMYF